MTINKAMIMAAGRGSRMMPFTDSLPKAMAPYYKTTLIAQGIQRIKKFVPNVYVTVGYKGDILARHVVSQGITGLFDTSGHDNAWWIFNTLMSLVDEPIYVLTCDNVVDLNYKLIQREYYNNGSPACMVVPVVPVSGLDGDYIVQSSGYVTDLSRTNPSDIYCSGIQVLNPYKINKLVSPVSNFYDIWSRLMSLNQLMCSSVYPERWFVADTLEQLSSIPFISD